MKFGLGDYIYFLLSFPGDADDSYEEPGTCMDDEYYGGSRGPREGTENVANLFADPVLAEKRFSRPLGYGERVTEDGVGSGDVASRDEGDAASSDVTQMSAKGPWGKRSGWSKNGAANDVGIGPKAAAVLGVLSEDEIGVSDTEGPSPSGADLLEDRTVSTGGGTRSDAPSLSDASMPSDGGRVPDAADTSFDSRDASIETMAASLGMYQDAGPDSKVSTFEAPRARRGPETSSQGGAGSAEVRGVEESRSGGGWLGQKVARVGLDGGLDLEEAVKRAISEHTGTETRAKKGAGRGGGISKAMAESLEALKKGKAGLGGMAEMAGKGRKGKKRKGTQEKDGAKADGGLVDTESAGTSLAGSEASEKRPGTGGENVMVGSDRAVSEALFGNWKNATSGRPANSFLNQAIAANAAQREENPAPSDLLTSAKIEGLGEADGVETASQPEGEASSERLLAAEPRSTSPKAGHPGRSETVADSSKPADPAPDPDQPSSSAEVSRNADQPGSAADISNLHSSAQPVNPEPSKPSGSAADSPNSESVTEANGQPSPNAPRKKGDYPDWMPHFLDKLHPDSPNFDPEAYAKTHPIKRALMDDDAAGRFPDFSLEALAAPAPELSRVPEDETFAPEHSSEDNRINEALNISEEQRGRVLEAANAAEFDPAAYDKSAPPWEAFRGFGTGARDMEGWDAEGQVNLPEGEQEFEIPTNGGGTRKVKIPADGFKSEQELIDAFGGKSFAIPLDVWNVGKDNLDLLNG